MGVADLCLLFTCLFFYLFIIYLLIVYNLLFTCLLFTYIYCLQMYCLQFIVYMFIVYSLWGFKKVPHEETCVWVLQISVYNYTLGNYDCFTESGFICEIELPTDL